MKIVVEVELLNHDLCIAVISFSQEDVGILRKCWRSSFHFVSGCSVLRVKVIHFTFVPHVNKMQKLASVNK